MSSQLLETKLRIPTPRSGSIPRLRLSEHLRHGRLLPLTLLSAPAGFGKTTLLADWLASDEASDLTPAWVSLDERDNDPMTFSTYVVTALHRASPGTGAARLTQLEPPGSPSEVVVVELINELVEHQAEVLLVLDDYHLIESADVHSSMELFVDNLPSNVHVVLAARSDPGIPLARMRARGQLVEIRAADLRFTPEEAAAYLNGSMGLSLSAESITALENRTEGWIAALQLAALSMQGRDDASAFIAGFTGDDRYT